MPDEPCGCDEHYCDFHFKEKSKEMKKLWDLEAPMREREKLNGRYCPECSLLGKLTGFSYDKLGLYECAKGHEFDDDSALMWTDIRKRDPVIEIIP